MPVFCLFVITAISVSCRPGRNITYLSNLRNSVEHKTNTIGNPELVIQPSDLLGISVSSLNVESNAMFNSGGALSDGYLVDKDGFIDYPVIGATKLSGLTRAEAKSILTAKLNEHVKNPIVNVRFLNFKVTVLGEVNNPSSFVILTDKVNIFEALGMAGDMTVYGRRENVLLIRERENIRTTVRLNLNDKTILNSPYFYLQQNDIIYVEPDRAKAAQTNVRRSNIQFGVTIATSILSIAVLFLTRVL